MGSFWDQFRAQSEEEKIRRKNAELDKKIGNKELEIKMIKKKLQRYRQDKFRRKMEKRSAFIKKITIEGLNRTSDRLMVATVEKLFSVENCRDLMSTCRDVSNTLKSLGIFKSVNVFVDTLSEPTEYQMRIIVKEANSSPYLNLGLNSPKENVVSGVVRTGLQNVFGGGERLEANFHKGIANHRLKDLCLMKPLYLLPPGSKAYLFLSESCDFHDNISSFVTETRLGSSLTVSCLEQRLRFKTSVSSSLLETKYSAGPDCPQHPNISRWNSNLVHCGHIGRARLTSSLTLDTRDDVLVPAQGVLCSAQHVLASNLVWGQLAHLVELRSCLHYSPVRGLSLSWRSLYSTSWGSYQPSPQEMPAYQGVLYTRGLTPPQGGSNNTSSLIISTLGLTSNLPFITSQSLIGRDVKLQAFLTAGAQPGSGETGGLEGVRTAAGLGLVGRLLQVARFELNLNLPLSCLGTRLAARPFLSFGLGTDFL